VTGRGEQLSKLNLEGGSDSLIGEDSSHIGKQRQKLTETPER